MFGTIILCRVTYFSFFSRRIVRKLSRYGTQIFQTPFQSPHILLLHVLLLLLTSPIDSTDPPKLPLCWAHIVNVFRKVPRRSVWAVQHRPAKHLSSRTSNLCSQNKPLRLALWVILILCIEILVLSTVIFTHTNSVDCIVLHTWVNLKKWILSNCITSRTIQDAIS